MMMSLYVIVLILLQTLHAALGQLIIPAALGTSWSIGYGFHLILASDRLTISNSDGTSIWSTVPTQPFISASAGNDSVTGSDGAFQIQQIDINLCQGQDLKQVQHISRKDAATGSGVQVSGLLLNCGGSDALYTATFYIPRDLEDRVAFDINVRSPPQLEQPLRKVYLRYSSNTGEDFYGLGAQASFASLKNQSVPIFSREQGVGRGDPVITEYENENGTFAGGNKFTTYTAIPSYISTDGNVFYLSQRSTAFTNFDFTESDAVTVRYDELMVEGHFTRAANMFDAVEVLTEYTGRMPSLPTWVDNGAILGIQGGQAKVNEIVKQGLALNCPIAGVWLQDWCGTHSQEAPYINISRLWWNWENDKDLYPNWSDFVQRLRDKYNVRTLSYINTFLANVSSKPDGYQRNLYAEANALHYFVQNITTNSTAIISSGPGLDAGIIDLTNPGLRSWFTQVLDSQVWSANISGFMSDFGEYTPVTNDTALANSRSDAFDFHDRYPLLWAEFQRGVVEELGLEDEALIFHRSASMGANRYMNLFWAGDQNVNWGVNDGIKSAVTIMAHMGMSGYAHSHSDIGGYTTTLTYSGFNVTRDPELLGRWGELAAVSSAIFRSHEGNVPQVNAQFYSNSSTYEYYAYNARMFVSLAPYRRRIIETECATKGWPLLRSPAMVHPVDLEARNISYQSFYLGPSLYVAPVLDPQTFDVDVYLPSGRTFTHVWTGKRYEGGQYVTVPGPYGQPAVFVVKGSGVAELKSFLKFVQREKGRKLSID